ncbi:MAG: hypothetical protein Q8O89_05900, partial [Nanoarchaeota archaeon]|nr:hypothetical protein [Nanoarchaeota archaeon]
MVYRQKLEWDLINLARYLGEHENRFLDVDTVSVSRLKDEIYKYYSHNIIHIKQSMESDSGIKELERDAKIYAAQLEICKNKMMRLNKLTSPIDQCTVHASWVYRTMNGPIINPSLIKCRLLCNIKINQMVSFVDFLLKRHGFKIPVFYEFKVHEPWVVG